MAGVIGLIPAHAGKTRRRSRARRPRGAHPRSRGENGVWATSRSRRRGSSPLTRGKLIGQARTQLRHRLIPAHAGKTSSHWSTNIERTAHPRSRGENLGVPAPRVNTAGSSPLTRGKRTAEAVQVLCQGLIPAHAGKTWRRIVWASLRSALPRSRGENARMSVAVTDSGGSSPLTRGKQQQSSLQFRTVRLIPAHAGKTVLFFGASSAVTAHPRSRGENDAVSGRSSASRGSSPLTRGKHQSSLQFLSL